MSFENANAMSGNIWLSAGKHLTLTKRTPNNEGTNDGEYWGAVPEFVDAFAQEIAH